MKKGKYENKAVPARKSASVRSLALLLALVLLLGGVIGGTIAWLTDETTEVKNTFSTSDITIELKETTTEYKMIPGWTIDKDPYVTVKAGSEACFLFVEVSESENLKNYIEYAVNVGTASTENGVTHGGWTRGTGDGGNGVPENVYYREVAKSDTAQVFAVLGGGTYGSYTWANDQVLTKPEVTKEMMAAVATSNQPDLSFTAYAIQLKNTNAEGGTTWDAAQAWAAISG